MPVLKNKNVILFFGCLAIFFPGSFVFGFPGVMAGEWQRLFSVSKSEIGRLMFFILAGTGFSMYVAGKIQEKIPGRYLILSGCLACAGATAFVADAKSITDVYIWAFLEGFFTAFVYIPCLTIYQKMFPSNKGLVTGILNLTFGGSAAVMSPVFTYFLISKGYMATSYLSAGAAALTGILTAFLIKLPESEVKPIGSALSNLTLIQTVKLRSFWLLWSTWALAGAAGVSLIVLSSSFGQQLGYEVSQYVYILTAFNILNGIGRLLCGRLADRLQKQKILMTVYLMAAGAYFLIPHLHDLYLISFLSCFIGLAFGGMFTVSAPLVTEVFGLENFGKVFGLVFTAYGFFAGFLGPWLSSLILKYTGSDFTVVFTMFACFYLVSALLVLKVRRQPG